MDHYLSNINIDLNGALATNSTSDTECQFQLDHSIQAPSHTHLLVALRTFSMPYAFYQFRDGINNELTITCDSDTGGTVSEIITIPPGNYNITELITNLNSQITGIVGALNLDSLGLNLDRAKMKVYFSLSYSTHTLNYISFATTFYREIGLPSTSAVSYTGTTGYFTKMVNLLGHDQLFLRLKNFQIDNRNMTNTSGIIAAIPVEVSPFQAIFYEPKDTIYFRLNTNYINQIDLQILDPDMNALGNFLVTGEFRITLTIKFSWDKDHIHPYLNVNKKLSQDYISNQIEDDDKGSDARTETSKTGKKSAD